MIRLLALAVSTCLCLAPQAASARQQVPKLNVRGTQFVDADTGVIYIPRWVSGLSLLSRTPEQQDAFLAWAAKTGFNGVRVFAGALTWAKQTPESALAGLVPLLDRAATHGLVVEVTALTDTGTGYDARQHVAAIVGRLAGRRGVVLELANEIGHGTQSAAITADRMRTWGRELVTPRGILWAVGAPLASDTPVRGLYAGRGGNYATAHLDRGGAPWQQVRRVRELYRIVEAHGTPAINNEPIGCAEPGTRGQRWNDPAMFFGLGALDRAFGLGGVHHSEAGLRAELPGPVQQRCADLYVAAHRAIDSVLPGLVGRVHDGGTRDNVVAEFGFLSEAKGVVVLLGVRGKPAPTLTPGWTTVRTLASHTARDGRRVEIVEVAKPAKQQELEAMARSARAAGQTEFLLSIGNHNDDANAPAGEYLASKSIVLATATKPPVVVRRESNVMTVHVLQVNRVLRTGATAECAPVSLTHGQRVVAGREVAVTIGGGAVMVDGVRITVKAFEHVDFVPGGQVLLVGWNCGKSTIELMHGSTDIFDVDKSGRLRFRGYDSYPFSTKLLELKKMTAIAGYLKNIR